MVLYGTCITLFLLDSDIQYFIHKVPKCFEFVGALEAAFLFFSTHFKSVFGPCIALNKFLVKKNLTEMDSNSGCN